MLVNRDYNGGKDMKEKKGYYYNGEYWTPTGRSTFLGPEYKGSRTGNKRIGGPPIVVNPRHDRRAISAFYKTDSDRDSDRDER